MNNKNITILSGLIAVGILLIVVFTALPQGKGGDSYARGELMFGGETIELLISDTEDLRTQGLSGRESLAEEEGMLFVFEESGRHGFWMKDMNFPIDILWLNSAFEVVYIVEKALPEDFPMVYTPEKEALYVIEVSAGKTGELGIKEGDILSLTFP